MSKYYKVVEVSDTGMVWGHVYEEGTKRRCANYYFTCSTREYLTSFLPGRGQLYRIEKRCLQAHKYLDKLIRILKEQEVTEIDAEIAQRILPLTNEAGVSARGS